MTRIEGYSEYPKREYCRDIHCPIQTLLEKQSSNPEEYEFIRGICKSNCIHTTHEFHSWLIEKGYMVVRPAK